MNEYRVSCDEEYIISSIERYRRQRNVYPWFIAVKVICALGLSLLLAIIVYATVKSGANAVPLVLITLVLGFFLFLLLQGPRIDYALLKRRLRKSPFYGDTAEIDVAPTGVSVRTPRSQLSLAWSAFTKARRLRGGFLVFTDPTVFHWWPDASLTSGSSAEVERLLRENIAAFDSNDA